MLDHRTLGCANDLGCDPGAGLGWTARRRVASARQLLLGLGDFAGIETSYQVFPTQQEALAKGYGQLFFQGGAIGITTPHGPLTIVDTQTIYPTMQDALKRGFGVLYQSGSQVVVSGPAGPTPINSPKLAPPPAPTPAAALPPPPAHPGGAILPPPPAPNPTTGAPTPLPAGGATTNPTAPTLPTGSVVTTSSGPAVVTGPSLTPVGTTAPADPSTGLPVVSPTDVPLDAPATGLAAPIDLPVIGPVPTWGVLAAVTAAVLAIARRRRAPDA